jgi:hypothetical protein
MKMKGNINVSFDFEELETFNYYDQLWIRRSIDERDKGKYSTKCPE